MGQRSGEGRVAPGASTDCGQCGRHSTKGRCISPLQWRKRVECTFHRLNSEIIHGMTWCDGHLMKKKPDSELSAWQVPVAISTLSKLTVSCAIDAVSIKKVLMCSAAVEGHWPLPHGYCRADRGRGQGAACGILRCCVLGCQQRHLTALMRCLQ